MSVMPQVRATALLDLPAVALEAGVDPYGPLKEAGINPSTLARPEMTIPADRVAWLLDGMAERNDLPDLGIRIAMRRRLANMGVAGLVLGQQSTVREALAMAEKYRYLLSDTLSLHIEENAERATVLIGLTIGASAPQRQSRELGLAAYVHLFRLMLGEGWSPDVVHFTHSAPRKATQHRRFFGCPVQFGSVLDGFECAAADLDRVNPDADETLATYAASLIDGLGIQKSGAATDMVTRLIHTLLPMGRASISNVARAMGRNVRTLQRELAAEQSEFSAILGDIRAELAVAYLKERSLSVEEISERLGYSSATAFIRFFRSRFGAPPGEWRNCVKLWLSARATASMT